MALLSEKTKKFLNGRRGQFTRMAAECSGVDNIIMVHSASYGEFEEIRPVVELIRERYPQYKILATFFSPSGYEYVKDDPIADFVYYLPYDTPGNVRKFLDIVRPVKVLVSISDFWLILLNELRRRKIPTYLVSACFAPGMSYFKPEAFAYRNAFRNCFTKILVRDRVSHELLKGIGAGNSIVVGDPRMDRVVKLASTPWNDELVDAWTGGEKVFVAGSTLPDEDDEINIALANAHPHDKFMIIPHEIGQKQIDHLVSGINGRVALYTDGLEKCMDAQVLIVNTVGMLAKLYRYGFASYVGSGFDCSPHSLLEPAAYGIPVSYGPLFGSYCHCQGLIDCGAGTSVSNAGEFCAWYDSLKASPELLKTRGDSAREYCHHGRGVADTIVKEIMD